MNLEQYNKEARQILHMTRVMLEFAHLGDWQKVTSLDAQRALLINRLFAYPRIDEVLHDISAIMEEVLKLNNEILQNGQGPLAQLGKELDAVTRGRRVTGVYKRIGNT